MEKRILILSLIFILTQTAIAQVAINSFGTAPDASAMLDVNSDSKGILIPRVTLVSETDNISPVNNPAPGLLVYNQGSNVSQGFYYWNGTMWSSFATMDYVVNAVNASSPVYAFSEMYEYNPVGSYSTISIPSSGTFIPWTSALQGDLNGFTFTSSSVIVENPGIFNVAFNATAQVPSGGKIVDAALFINGTVRDDLHSRIWFKEGGKSQNISFSGIISLTSNDVISVRFTQNDDGIIRIETANLSITQINGN